MAADLSSLLSMGPKRASLEEVNIVHKRMLNLVKLEKELDAEMTKLAPDPSNWEQLWQTQYNDFIEKLENNDGDLFEEEDSEDEITSVEDADEMVENRRALSKKPQSLRAAMEKQLSLLDRQKKIGSRRIDFFKKFLDVESKRNEILTQKATMSAQIKDLLELELNSEEVLDPEQEPTRRAILLDMARWWDCLLYNMSVELNQPLQDEEIGKWSDLYLKWCMWTDLKAGVLHGESAAQTN